jgi:hypothetical protein
MHQLGFTTGNKTQVIPWGSLVKDPASWMMAECIPDGFEWKDPSKVQVGEVFRLLDHWRDREDQGLQPLVWLPSSPLFVDTKQSNRHAQSIRQAAALEPQDSEEEVFVLPHSDEFDEENDDSITHNQSYQSPSVLASSDDSGALMELEPPVMQLSDPTESSSGKSHDLCAY